jgi:hypothetical protein
VDFAWKRSKRPQCVPEGFSLTRKRSRTQVGRRLISLSLSLNRGARLGRNVPRLACPIGLAALYWISAVVARSTAPKRLGHNQQQPMPLEILPFRNQIRTFRTKILLI